jgi:oxygen-independent coproporphyrinogen-3 oxidase
MCLNRAAQQASGRVLTSIYFGGGTPSLLPAVFVGDILDEIQKLWTLDSNCEISIEMNPGYVTEKVIASFSTAGINRVSIGVQSLTNEGLAVLGRTHTVQDALSVVKTCSKYFKNHSIDLMYAWPTQSIEDLKKELVDIFALDCPHISIYQLIIEPDSVFGSMYSRGEILMPDENTCTDMFDYLQEATDKAGLPSYEVANHAHSGLECRHSISYWKYIDYIGIGPGAHSRLTINRQKYAMVQESNPQKWLNSIIDNQHILEEVTALSLEEQCRETILVGLRMTEGMDVTRLPLPFSSVVDQKAYERLLHEKYLVKNGDVLATTIEGRRRLNALISYLVK